MIKNIHGIEFKKRKFDAVNRQGKPFKSETLRHEDVGTLDHNRPDAIDQRVNEGMKRFLK